MAIITPVERERREDLRLGLATVFAIYLSEEASKGLIEDALEDLAKIEDYILGETE